MQHFQLNNSFNLYRIKLRFLHEKSFKSWRVLQRVQNKNRKTQRLNGKNCQLIFYTLISMDANFKIKNRNNKILQEKQSKSLN